MNTIKQTLYRFVEGITNTSIYNYRFKAEDSTPIIASSSQNLTTSVLQEIVARYTERGFAVLEFTDEPVTENIIIATAQQINLGIPIKPTYYKNEDTEKLYDSKGINTISAADNASEINHQAFQSRKGQGLHSDGTLFEIGKVKTSVLLCVSQAPSGGETTLFNSVGAFVELVKVDLDAAISLLNPNCLTRTSKSLQNPESYTGPAFALQASELISRFSIDDTSDWNRGLESATHLDKALNFLITSIEGRSSFYGEVKLKPGQLIIVANDKVSHGRLSYDDSPAQTRKMLRGIFTGRPYVGGR